MGVCSAGNCASARCDQTSWKLDVSYPSGFVTNPHQHNPAMVCNHNHRTLKFIRVRIQIKATNPPAIANLRISKGRAQFWHQVESDRSIAKDTRLVHRRQQDDLLNPMLLGWGRGML